MSETLVRQMIASPENHIRKILMSLCNDEGIKNKAIARHVALLEAAKPGNEKKRKASDALLYCMVCESPFHEGENVVGACMWHPGESELDQEAEVWETMDLYDEWRDPDDEWHREEWPEGFKWSCCGKAHDAPGCESDRHDPTDGTKRLQQSPQPNTEAAVVVISDDEEN